MSDDKDRAATDNIEETMNSMEQDKWYSLRMGADPFFSPPSTFFTDVDTKNKVLICVYIGIFLAAYIVCHWYKNYSNNAELACDLFGTFGTSFIAFDIIFFGVAIAIYIGCDFWKMGFSIYSFILYLIFSLLVAIAITTPIYLALRVSRQCKIDNGNRRPKKKEISCWQSFIPFVIYIVLMVFYLIGPTAFQEPNLCTK